MNTETKNTGILEISCPAGWLAGSQFERDRANSVEQELPELVHDLIRTAEINKLIRQTCLAFLARFNVTSWGEDNSAIKFWCNGFDATFRSHVSPNPLNRDDPPVCLLSVELGGAGRTLYGSMISDIGGVGPLLLSQAIRALIVQAFESANE
jgi:hypothetical protein